jgi:hypothetical protein
MMMRTLSGVLSTVEKRPISATDPETPDASTKSPRRKGRKIRSITPDAMFERVPCIARPMASPAAPTTAIIEVVSIPKSSRTAITTTVIAR